MLSKTSSRILRFSAKWTSFLGGMPFDWDEKRSQIRISEKGWAKWTFWVVYLIFNFVNYLVRIIFVILSTSSKKQKTGYFDPGQYIYEKVKGYQIMVIYAIGIIISLNTWKHMQEIAAFVNSFIRYSQHFRNAYIKRLGRDWRNNCETILRFLTITMFAFPLLATYHYFTDPGDIRYMTYFLPPPPTTPPIIYLTLVICYGGLHAFWCFAAISATIFYSIITILPAFVAFQMLHEIRGDEFYYLSRPVVRRPPRLCQIYRSLQLLVRLWNDALTSCAYPLKACAESFSVVGNAQLVKFFRLESPVGRALLLLGPNIYLASWLLSLGLYGLMWKRSRAVVTSWQDLRLRGEGDTVLMRKFRRSAGPLKFRIGGMYNVQPGRVLVTLHSVLRSTLKFLLAIKKRMH